MYPTDLDQCRALLDAACAADDHAEVDRIITHVNTLDQALLERLARPEALTSAALWYARKGWPVFPLRPGEKQPATKHGFLDATIDPDQVLAWWVNDPQANIGHPTGILHDVIDIDGPPGFRSAAGLTMPEPLAVASTPRGKHLYVPVTGRGNTARVGDLDGIDYRGRGGYVVLPPSIVNDRRYAWVKAPA